MIALAGMRKTQKFIHHSVVTANFDPKRKLMSPDGASGFNPQIPLK